MIRQPIPNTQLRGSTSFAIFRSLAIAFIAAGCVLLCGLMAQAQSTDQFAGLGGNNDDPIEIEAGAAEIRQAENRAILSGGVTVRQGEAVLKTATVYVNYAEGAQAGGNQQITLIEAPSKVAVTVRDQTATGDRGVFDYLNENLTVTGNVILSQGPNVMRGDRLIVDLRSGKARMEGGKPVQILIQPRSLQ